MQIRFWTVGLIVALMACSGSALAQAAAEAALTHGLSAGASSSAGSAFGKLGNQLAGRLGQQVSTTVPRPVITTVRPGVQKQVKVSRATTQIAPAQPAPGGSMIASIQGAEPQTQPCALTAPDNAKIATSAEKPSNCSAPTAPDAILYKSEITLPASK